MSGLAGKVGLFTAYLRLVGINFGPDKARKLNSPSGSVFMGSGPSRRQPFTGREPHCLLWERAEPGEANETTYDYRSTTLR